ncbi:P-loop containing nucleoside triphosphate hydrolase protein [Mycena vulgaris]|nr:P-loop containing nucleoside triphosphate hydrolase protein [Mycena vulgaris]
MPSLAPDTNTLLDYTRSAARVLQDISNTTNIPLLKTVSVVTFLVLPIVQDIRANKERCMRMVDKELLCILAPMCLTIRAAVSPRVLDDIGRFAQNLHKFYACLRSEQELGKIKRFFKQTEINAQLEACEGEMGSLLETFKVQSSIGATRQKEILSLLETRSISESSDAASLVRAPLESSFLSGAFSLLPAPPQIFHGRESELEDVVDVLLRPSARLIILGTGGMGKTSLALASLHHPRIQDQYPRRHFVSCESANNVRELISIVGSHLGLEPSRLLSKAIISHLLNSGPAVLVLDNMETPWEPHPTRAQVEEFLSLLADVPHLALLVTMRGAERPVKVKWSRPFLPPLEPISAAASRRTFVDIAQEPMPEEETALAELIELTGNLPLAVGLMANVASFEGYIGALSRWNEESTALFSDGYDKRSNLERSITMSLTSPRMQFSPDAHELLSLLSLLPDGISEAELLSGFRSADRCSFKPRWHSRLKGG